MEKKIPVGSEVLIFKYVGAMGSNQDNFHYKKGVVKSCFEMEELSSRALPKTRYYYSVEGEDGNIYYGNYGTGNVGSSFFRTKKDYKIFLGKQLEKLADEKELIERQMDYYTEIRERLTQKAKPAVQKAK